MTFDEALKAIDEKSDMEPYSGLFLIDIEDAKAIVMKLANTYAPTIKMTENQKNAFDKAKRLLNTRDLALNFGQEWTILDEVSGKVFGHAQGEATNEQIEATMQAWLHPERIKVID